MDSAQTLPSSEQQDRQSRREFVSGESHYFEGRRYRLDVVESRGPVDIRLRNNAWMEMRVRPATDRDAREALLYRWYRAQLRQHIPEIIGKWESRLGVHVADWRIRRMKTRWGSCNAAACRIWLNSELAKKPLPCLEYVVVHEMAHLAEPSHNDRYREILDSVNAELAPARRRVESHPSCRRSLGGIAARQVTLSLVFMQPGR